MAWRVLSQGAFSETGPLNVFLPGPPRSVLTILTCIYSVFLSPVKKYKALVLLFNCNKQLYIFNSSSLWHRYDGFSHYGSWDFSSICLLCNTDLLCVLQLQGHWFTSLYLIAFLIISQSCGQLTAWKYSGACEKAHLCLIEKALVTTFSWIENKTFVVTAFVALFHLDVELEPNPFLQSCSQLTATQMPFSLWRVVLHPQLHSSQYTANLCCITRYPLAGWCGHTKRKKEGEKMLIKDGSCETLKVCSHGVQRHYFS